MQYRAGVSDRPPDGAAEGLVPEYVRRLAWILDDAIPIVGKRRVGLDGVMSFVPVIGDTAGFGLATIVVLAGVRAGCSWPTVARMTIHAVGEAVTGMVPLVGPLIAFAWKANSRNLRIIEADLGDREATRRESWQVILVGLGLAGITLALILVSLVVATYTLWRWLMN